MLAASTMRLIAARRVGACVVISVCATHACVDRRAGAASWPSRRRNRREKQNPVALIRKSRGRPARHATIDFDLSGAPKKKRRHKAIPPRRVTTYKNRTAWFKARVAWPNREPSAGSLLGERARAAATLPALAGTAQWELVGPTNIGGRMTSLAYAPNKPNKIWAGAAGGGVWTSNSSGSGPGGRCGTASRHSISDRLRLIPVTPRLWIADPGEANFSADSYPGVGVFRSTDGGETWQ